MRKTYLRHNTHTHTQGTVPKTRLHDRSEAKCFLLLLETNSFVPKQPPRSFSSVMFHLVPMQGLCRALKENGCSVC